MCKQYHDHHGSWAKPELLPRFFRQHAVGHFNDSLNWMMGKSTAEHPDLEIFDDCFNIMFQWFSVEIYTTKPVHWVPVAYPGCLASWHLAQVYCVLMTPWCFSFYFLRCLGFRPCCSPGRPDEICVWKRQHNLRPHDATWGWVQII